ncbi:MAG: hypothetical protein AAGU05_03390, partial [Anaerolineaceae bacterium]
MHKRFLFLITIICLATAACVTSAPLPDATAAMPAAEMLPSPTETAAEKTPRALTPEDIVYSFITAFADNPDEMVLYLSDSLKESLPEGGI